MPTQKKRRHRKRKTYKRGGMVLKAIRTTQPDGYADSKIMPSSNNKALFDKEKFVPSVNTPWLLRFNEAKYANHKLFGMKDDKSKIKSGTVHLVLNSAMEEEQANLYNELDRELAEGTDDSFNAFLKNHFPSPGRKGGAPVASVPSVESKSKEPISEEPISEEIQKDFNKATLWPKEVNTGFYYPGTFSNILSSIFKKQIKDDKSKALNNDNINELRVLMYKHRASVYDLIDDKMVEKLMDSVDNDNTKYSSIYRKDDTTTYNNIRYVIMWILFKTDIISLKKEFQKLNASSTNRTS